MTLDCDNDSNVILAIKDSGIGIPKEKLKGLFSQFTKSSKVGIEEERVTGLGLSIVRNLIKKHHGSIEGESEPNKGSTFRVILPKN